MHCPIGIMGKDFKEDKKKKEFPNVSKVAVIWFPGAYTQQLGEYTLTFSDAPSHRWIDICWVYSRLWSVSKIYPSWCCAYINVLNGYITTSEPLLFVYTFPWQGHLPNGMRASSSSRLCTSSYGEKGEMMSFTLPRGANATATGRESYVSEMFGQSALRVRLGGKPHK